MKSIRMSLLALAAVASLAFSGSAAVAQAYPVTNPTYIPTAVLAPATFTTTGDYTFNTSGVSAATVRITGTCTSLVAAVQGTNDNTNWTTLPAVAATGGGGATSLTTTGFWRVNTAGFTRARVHITTLAASCTVAMAATPAAAFAAPAADPCQDPNVPKSFAVVNVGAATTTKLVDVSGTTSVYVCGFSASLAGTTPSVTFKSGTNVSTDCDTAPATLSGVILPTSGAMVYLAASGTVLKTAAAKQLCATTVGTGSSLQGIITYVQQ